MHAVVLREPGPPQALRVEELPAPEAQAGQVPVQVALAGVNRYDLNIRAGRSQAQLPLVLGLDCVGSRADTGERVLVTGWMGCYAELVAVGETHLWAVPTEVADEAAAALGTPFKTAWHALVEKGRLTEESRLLVQAGASTTGLACIQLGLALGASVVATASEGKLERLASLGAHALPYGHPQLRTLEADVVYDPAGGATVESSLAALGRGGRIVIPGALGDSRLQLDAWALVGKEALLVGLGSAPSRRETLERLLALCAAGKLTPTIDRVLPLAQAAEAHRLLEAREAFGSVLLRP